MVEVRQRFDPAVHLSKQGWKGKGSALKHGHLTRPLAVVKKKTLSGIGKDRDEAVPFWDHIFAATAASIQTSSGATTPVASTSASPAPPPAAPSSSMSITARKGKEAARRGLYSRFLRGAVLGPEKVTFDDLTPAGSSTAPVDDQLREEKAVQTGKKRKRKRSLDAEAQDNAEPESKEDRKARRAEKAQRKAEKELRRKRKANQRDEVPVQVVGDEPIAVAVKAKKKKKSTYK